MTCSLADLQDVLEKDSNTLYINGLSDSSFALTLSRMVTQKRTTSWVVITESEDLSQKLIDDLSFFSSPTDRNRIAHFPLTGTLPFSRISPEPEIWADRLQILYKLIKKEPLILITSVEAISRRLPPKEFISSGSRELKMDENIDRDELIRYLADFGYEDIGLVENEGSFAHRGGILDIWSPTNDLPVRIELDGNRIMSMRFFDSTTQRSKKMHLEIQKLELIPVSEIPFDKKSRSLAAHRVRDRSDAPLSSGEKRTLIESIHEGISFSGIDTLLPLFHKSTSTFFDYLPDDSIVLTLNDIDIEESSKNFHTSAKELFEGSHSPERIINPDEILLNFDDINDAISNFTYLKVGNTISEISDTPTLNFNIEGNRDIRPMIVGHKDDEDMLSPFVRLIKEWKRKGWHTLLTCHTQIQADRLGDLFHTHGIELMSFDAPFDTLNDMETSTVKLKIGRLSQGFRWPNEKLAIVTDEEIFGEKITRRVKTHKPMEPFTSFTELAKGDYIVHEQHGIARYLGLEHLSINDKAGDYMLLEYMGGDKLYLPVYRLNLVGKYIGSGEGNPPLDKLGGIRWSSVQKKVRRDVSMTAVELLRTFAEREIHSGFSFPDGGTEYEEFCASFPYDETPDQSRAIEDVMNDMSVDKSSDRLICGDVGYGKTEVAMRAAYRATMAGKQVAILVPTTVLALQHYENFIKRFSEAPVSIEMLSRFKSLKERKEIVENIKRGTVDIIIGTHRLIQKDISFKNLGLLIIDEEHRFGVKHKERIKKLRSAVDVISLTATPIPRTLNLSLVGIRDISVINTPPIDRMSISTYVTPFDEGIIRQAIMKEVARGGQVFFVHNRVETIASLYRRLTTLLPGVKIVVGHGKLKEKALENVMIDFLEKRADVLLCTTIIESGLDIPNANTIIIHRADTFGLAQLYQLRGRVGRSNLRAYAYLLTPESGEMTPLAKKRLAVLKRFTELGSGFQIAMHDLEFRGAGNILGSAQSGHINSIGYELYTKLLDRTIRKLKGLEVREEVDPELNLKVSAFLPEGYIPDQGTRVELYRRLASRETEEELMELAGELHDRFGPLPDEAINMIKMMEIKILALILKVQQLTFDGAQFSCQLGESTPLKPEKVMELVEKESSRYRLVPPDKLLILADDVSSEHSILKSAKNCLSRLTGYVT
ncbi:MAG: transcription-repair coupling factor [Deltaproteobacteria bacterium]|nr:transcription-repair coupling factor [Deltaproteobacteria bacterium]